MFDLVLPARRNYLNDSKRDWKISSSASFFNKLQQTLILQRQVESLAKLESQFILAIANIVGKNLSEQSIRIVERSYTFTARRNLRQNCNRFFKLIRSIV